MPELLVNLTPGARAVALSVLRALKAHNGYTGTGGDGNYCRHGVNLGYWDGPDYMCGACESGVSDYEYALGAAYDHMRRETRERKQTELQAFCVWAKANASRDDLTEITHAWCDWATAKFGTGF
jgi:hypothetical protein